LLSAYFGENLARRQAMLLLLTRLPKDILGEQRQIESPVQIMLRKSSGRLLHPAGEGNKDG
jgi:hypothetical protein